MNAAYPVAAWPCLTLLALSICSGGLGCGPPSVPNPFWVDGGLSGSGGSGTGGAGGGSPDSGTDDDPTLGGPCADDGQCDDGVACTFDECDDSLARCRFTPDDQLCQNTVFCDGVEQCDPKLGCTFGAPIACSDTTACTIDACVEATQTCTHAPRDADQDGDPDGHCPQGHDCDDTDPTVSSLLPEVCDNQKDDNCSGAADEATCTAPKHDTCLDPLEITAAGSYAMSTVAAKYHYATSCSLAGPPQPLDVVAAILLAPGPPVDVEVTARATKADVALAMAGQCWDPATEIACGGNFASPQGAKIAKVRGRSLGSPSDVTAVPVVLQTSLGAAAVVDVALLPPTSLPSHETCGTAIPITPGVPEIVPIVDAAKDLATACASATGDLVYHLSVSSPSDLHVYATSIDGDGLPSISLRTSACALPEDEITCQTAANAHIFRHSLPAGDYYIGVSASAPSTLSITAELSPPTPSPAGDACSGAPPVVPNETFALTLSDFQDDVDLGCLPGAADAVRSLVLAQPSDVLLLQRISQYDYGAVALALPACASPTDQLACGTGSPSPVRVAKHNVPAGDYRLIIETQQSQPVEFTAFVRPAVAPTLVLFADGCADAFDIPSTGGRFQGTTANATADFTAGCDQGSLPPFGARDQLLRLSLPAQKRVVLSMDGSAYRTLLDVRKGPTCPGTEVLLGCGIAVPPRHSFLDLTLDAGVYFIQIDGHALENGPWFLDVHVVDP